MEFSSELIISAFIGILGVVGFLFKIVQNGNASFRKSTNEKMDDLSGQIKEQNEEIKTLNREILHLTKERADMMYKVGKLEEENKALRRRLSEIDHEEPDHENQSNEDQSEFIS